MTETEGSTTFAEFLAHSLSKVRPLPATDIDLIQATGSVLATDVSAPAPLPAFDYAAIDGYAANADDILGATEDHSVGLKVLGDLSAASWRPVRLVPNTCFAVAAGAPLPIGANVVVPLSWTDEGMATVEVRRTPKRGHGVQYTGTERGDGSILAQSGRRMTPQLIALLAASGLADVTVRPTPRVVVIATGDELVDTGRPSQPGQVIDVNSHLVTAGASEAGAHAYRVGICDDEPEALRNVLDDQVLRADFVITTGGTSTGPGDMVRRTLSRDRTVDFPGLSIYQCESLGFGTIGPEEIPILCLPGNPVSASLGFEILARPIILRLAGAEPVFRPSVRANLTEAITSPLGRREFRPVKVTERRGGGYTVTPLGMQSYTLSGFAEATGLMAVGENASTVPAGSTVDVMLLDRHR
ncbi:gephyrin-like molybdotransferase Glp [Haloglycomyces albus]|uniref:molybdopterin molybdotransferase MoeA n=1 Tax=Haloglycomyces albus TaxID=526067 RepID=UPI00046D4C96|nr:gephyrin-like molybdotransferase Glp [Haloglycomyces albus]